MAQRIEFVDLAKGICISLVVLLHVFGDLSGAVIQIMNLFRMPLYFVLSGLFFKTYDGLFPFIKKKTNKLLIPFFFTFFIIILPTTYFLNRHEGTTTTLSNLFWGGEGKLNLGIDGAIWFLLCLFFVNIIFYLIFLLTKRKIAGITILTGLCGIAGYYLNARQISLLLWIDSSLTAMPFFWMGYALRNYTNVLYESFTRKEALGLLTSTILLLAVFIYDEWQGTGVIMFGENIYDISIASLYLGGAVGTYCVLMIAKFLKHLPIVSYIGRYSIVVLLTHLLYLFVIRNALYHFGVPQDEVGINMVVFVVIIVLSVPTIAFCIKYLPYWFAQKDLWC